MFIPLQQLRLDDVFLTRTYPTHSEPHECAHERTDVDTFGQSQRAADYPAYHASHGVSYRDAHAHAHGLANDPAADSCPDPCAHADASSSIEIA